MSSADLDDTSNIPSNISLQIFVCTWNTNKGADPQDLHEFFNESCLTRADVIAVGLQEVPLEHSQLIEALQLATGSKHSLYAAESFGTILLVVFLRSDLLPVSSQFFSSSVHLRACNCICTKGTTAVHFKLFDSSFLFLTSHLAAGHSWQKLYKRTVELRKIHDGIRLPFAPDECIPGSCRFDSVDFIFWAGDFNFRLSEERKSVEKIVKKVLKAEHVREDEIKNLLAWDQLTRYKMVTTLRDFEEFPISFLPAYKYDPRTHTYDTSRKQRIPSYTDRILFRSKTSGAKILCKIYGSPENTVSSDHKPVYAIYEVIIPRIPNSKDSSKSDSVSIVGYPSARQGILRKRRLQERLSACGCGVV